MAQALSHPVFIRRDGELFGLVSVRSYWEAYGCSRRGRPTKRHGKTVTCGHKHKSEAAAEKCEVKMRRARQGRCQDYRTRPIEFARYKRAT